MPRTLIDHYESYLGRIAGGWDKNSEGYCAPFQVVQFSEGCRDGTISFATLGLSNFSLPRPEHLPIRMELFLSIYPSSETKFIPGILEQIGLEMIEAKEPLLRGHFFFRPGHISPPSPMTGIYVTKPLEMPDPFHFFRSKSEDYPSATVAWLCPITESEGVFLREQGWKAFEMLCDRVQPDFSDMERESLI